MRTAAPAGRRIGAAGLLAVLVATPAGLLWLAWRTGSARLRALDSGVAHRLNEVALSAPPLVDALVALSWAAHPWVLRVLTLAGAAALWRRARHREAVWLAVTVALGTLLGWGLKAVVGRQRPELVEPVWSAGGLSFPSGHALHSMLFAGSVVVLALPYARRAGRLAAGALWTVAGAFVVLVGLDRVALGVHFVSDVLAGWSVALAVLVATAPLLRRVSRASSPATPRPRRSRRR